MIDEDIRSTTITLPRPPAESPSPPATKKPLLAWHRLGLAAITAISVVMNFYQLGANGYSSYYAAAIRSMLDSWHNFFFVAYDPGGFVTIDKPPVGFWLEAISAKIFGFNSTSILLPSALAGVLSVVLLYHLVRRHFGVVAGLLAALALALNPISILTNRNITIDSMLTLVMLLGAWTVMRAAETGKLRWLLLTATLIGVGFNIKMLEAYLVIPAFALLYLLASPVSVKKRLAHLAVAGALLLVISLSWVTIVDLTPASQRPYVGSTQNNSEISLALGYNGIQRLLGMGAGTGSTGGSVNQGMQGTPPTRESSGTSTSQGTPPENSGGQTPPSGGMMGGNGGGSGGSGLFDTGTAGPFRLFIQPLATQIAWLLPFAVLGAVALAWQKRPKLREDRQQQSLVLWGTWLLTMGAFFSVAGFFHQYYMTVMSPAIAALFGIGMVIMWRDFRKGGWRAWMLPVAIIATCAEQIYILSNYAAWGQILIPILAVVGVLAVGTLVAVLLVPRLRNSVKTRFLSLVLALAVLGLMITPTAFVSATLLQSTSTDTLVVSPGQTISFSSATNGRGTGTQTNTALINYLVEHQGNTKYLVAVTSSRDADSIILATNEPVMTLGGFSGSDPILTTDELAALVKSGTVKYFLVSGDSNGGPSGGQSSLSTWIKEHGTLISSSEYQSSSTTSNSNSATQLYEITSVS